MSCFGFWSSSSLFRHFQGRRPVLVPANAADPRPPSTYHTSCRRYRKWYFFSLSTDRGLERNLLMLVFPGRRRSQDRTSAKEFSWSHCAARNLCWFTCRCLLSLGPFTLFWDWSVHLRARQLLSFRFLPSLHRIYLSIAQEAFLKVKSRLLAVGTFFRFRWCPASLRFVDWIIFRETSGTWSKAVRTCRRSQYGTLRAMAF